MERDLRDELEVEGDVRMYKIRTHGLEDIDRMREMMRLWEEKGWVKLNDVPDGEEKVEFIRLARKVGFTNGFQ